MGSLPSGWVELETKKQQLRNRSASCDVRRQVAGTAEPTKGNIKGRIHPMACRTGFRFEATGVPSSGAGTGPSEKALAHLGMGAKGKKGRERIHGKRRNGASPQIPGPLT